MRLIVAVIIFMVIGAGGYFYFTRTSSLTSQNDAPIFNPEVVSKEGSESKEGTKTAAFAIFTNGTFRIFTDSMYHNRSEDVFIEGSNPNVINIRKQNLTWGDFFNTLPFKLTAECLITGTGQTFCDGKGGSLSFFINQTKDPEALNKVINQGDKLLVSFGDNSDSVIAGQFQKIPNP